MVPSWLHILSILILALGLLCAAIVLVDVIRHPQHMGIMNIVWPVTALFGTLITVWGYFRYGRLASSEAMMRAKKAGKEPPNKTDTPFPAMVAKGASHCGSGCCIGDICAEWLAFAAPGVAVWFGWHSIFSEKMYAVWVLDFIFAFVLGVAFQYFTIVPMRHLGKLEGIWQALKADTLSLTAWQVGMYCFMAVANFWLFRKVLGVRLEVNSPEFWFMMQIAMICGFITSYPVNWWLLKSGIKEKM
ncbi:DUF4396 domain-containing protein [Noviherbaspirillum pedocola]|uniref:DUF4396 domain-containing protein n=1 Tax=Noviherbaspirillum pedocola TaxID=2801341 RepID=A0A934SYD8_9BURK|nr:DUF4396 domain-containing protein [Noviherbaspirillum pedocola]MBK4738825.1 DUF4396 domain-containing protein [Noviherbaspirillum pedocola]